MRSKLVLHAVDSHTEGMPTRVITGGVGVIPGATMSERRTHFIEHMDHLRTLLMYEPRGHAAMSGAILQPPTRPDADYGVLFIEVSGCLPMCGHGTIGVATVLVETGMVPVTEPVTTIRLDTPAGLVTAEVAVGDGAAKNEMLAAGLALMAAINDEQPPVHPTDPTISGCHHVHLIAPGATARRSRHAMAIHPGWFDRSPCGTGTAARMAQLHARGELPLNQDFVNESLIGSTFTGRLIGTTEVGPFPAVVPTVTGRAWITGTAQYLLDPTDPFPAGFLL